MDFMLRRVVKSLVQSERRSLARNTFFSAFTSGVTFLSSSILFILLGRTLDIEQFGTIGLAMAVSTMVALLPSYGFDLFVIRELAQGTYSSKKVIGNIVIVKLLWALIALICLQLYIHRSVSQYSSVFWLFGLAAILLSFTKFFNSVLKAHEDFYTETMATTIQSLVQFFLIVSAILLFEFSVMQVGWLVLLSRIVALLFSVQALLKDELSLSDVSSWYGFDVSVAWRLTRSAFPFALQTILGTIYFQSDTIIISELLDTINVGYYQAGGRLVTSFMRVANVLMSAFYPRVAQSLAGSIEGKVNLSVSRLFMHFMLSVGGILTLFFFGGAKSIILVLYGEKMAPAIPVLRVLGLVFVVRFVAGGYGLILISCHRQIIQLLGAIIAVITNITLNLVLVPRYGVVAAAWANTLTNIVVLGIYLVFIRKTLGTLMLRGFVSSMVYVLHHVKLFLVNMYGVYERSVIR
jgi:O-antigen/teichoic acid export membrane protein